MINQLQDFSNDARNRWEELTSNQPANSPARFTLGYYEMGFSLVNAKPSKDLPELQTRLTEAGRTMPMPWHPFWQPQEMEYKPHPYKDFVETWLGKPSDTGEINDSLHGDFWRASRDGKLYTIRPYLEDHREHFTHGEVIEVNLPIWRIAEGLMFASRFAETFEEVDEIAIHCRFTGLDGRRLDCFDEMNRVMLLGLGLGPPKHVSHRKEITLNKQVSLRQAQDNLPQVIHTLLGGLYERFGRFDFTLKRVQGQLQKMRSVTY